VFDILSPITSSPKARRVSESLLTGAQKAGLNARLMHAYRPRPGATLVVYGAGGPDRWPFVQAHKGPLICWDIGYWDRNADYANRKFRVSFGGMHPKNIMTGERPSPDRWHLAGLSIRASRRQEAGTVMLVGNGPKSVAVGAENWAAKKSREIRDTFPLRRIAYRPKPKRPHEHRVRFDELSTGPIDDALKRTSLVVCRHSNVAVDACRLGIPVVCDDGAAACIYPQRLEDEANQPSLEVRTEFLHRLAWWQWSPTEMESGAAWKWIVEKRCD
jgi:hypothetical protein